MVELNTCLEGLGGRWESVVYYVPIVRQYENLAITQLGMLNTVVALKLFASSWQSRKIHIKCDNLAVVQVLKSGRTRDPFLGACTRNSKQTEHSRRLAYQMAQFVELHAQVLNPVWLSVPHDILDVDMEI